MKIDTSEQAYARALCDYLFAMPELQRDVKVFLYDLFVRQVTDGQVTLPSPDLVYAYLRKFPTYEEWKQNIINLHTLQKVGKLIGDAEMFRPKTR